MACDCARLRAQCRGVETGDAQDAQGWEERRVTAAVFAVTQYRGLGFSKHGSSLLTALGAGSPRSRPGSVCPARCRTLVRGWCLLAMSSHGRRGEGPSGVRFIRLVILFMAALPS